MDNQTFRSRVAVLIQKCRKAVRLYTSMGRMHGTDCPDYSETQIQVWREINADLLRHLTSIMEISDMRALVTDMYLLRDRFYTNWREAESEMHLKQKQLIISGENGDFIKASILSKDLIELKARSQACQAAHHELQSVVGKSRATQVCKEIEKDESLDEKDSPLLQQAKVIPLRRRTS